MKFLEPVLNKSINFRLKFCKQFLESHMYFLLEYSAILQEVQKSS